MNVTNKKVFFLTISLRGGGAERQISELYNDLPVEKIICIEQGNVYGVDNGKIITLSKHNERTSSLFKYLYLPIYLYRLYKRIKPNKNTIIVSFLERANLLNAISKFFFKNISIQSIRTTYSVYCKQKKIPALLKKLIVRSYKYADLIVGNSVGNVLDLVHNYSINKKKTIVINNFYNIQKIKEFSQEKLDNQLEDIFSNHKTIIYVSRFDNKKGHSHLIRILSVLKKENTKCKLFLIGAGELKKKLIELCNLLKLIVFDIANNQEIHNRADIYLMGFQKNPYSFITKCSLFAFPSILEGLPNALIEAIICNAFCIAADCPSGPKEIMTGNTSIQEPITNPQLTPYGYLMPPFSGELILNDSALTATEKIWKNIIAGVLQKDIPKIDTSTFIHRFSKKGIINEWENIINQF